MSTPAEMIEQYIRLRDHKAKADKEFKKSMERVNLAMTTIENNLLQHFEDNGTSSAVAKGIGTAYVRVVTSMTTEDRDQLLKWALTNKELGALDIRPNKTIINEKLDSGEVVPGVKVTQTRLVGIRRK